MSKLTKKEKIIQEKLDPNLSYSVDEAMEILQSVKSKNLTNLLIYQLSLEWIQINLIRMLEGL